MVTMWVIVCCVFREVHHTEGQATQLHCPRPDRLHGMAYPCSTNYFHPSAANVLIDTLYFPSLSPTWRMRTRSWTPKSRPAGHWDQRRGCSKDMQLACYRAHQQNMELCSL